MDFANALVGHRFTCSPRYPSTEIYIFEGYFV
jgi:hypothetical protein